jgi:hypothetical protein
VKVALIRLKGRAVKPRYIWIRLHFDLNNSFQARANITITCSGEEPQVNCVQPVEAVASHFHTIARSHVSYFDISRSVSLGETKYRSAYTYKLLFPPSTKDCFSLP